MLLRYITLSYSDSGGAHHRRRNHYFPRHPHVGSTIINTFSVSEMARFFFGFGLCACVGGAKNIVRPRSS
jgi:hypothetical protein